MKVLIIEDERSGSAKLVRQLKAIDSQIVVLDVLQSVEESVNWIVANPAPDLIFMDIQLEDGISFEIFEKVKIYSPVIFTTAYDEYAIKAFKVNSIDYLLKPIAIEDLKQSLEKFNTLHKGFTQRNQTMISSAKELLPTIKERVLVKIGERYISVILSKAVCIYSIDKSVFLITDTGASFPLDLSLDKLEKILNPTLFFRVNRNYIINFNFIKEIITYSSNRLKLILSTHPTAPDILVSRERVNQFKHWLDR